MAELQPDPVDDKSCPFISSKEMAGDLAHCQNHCQLLMEIEGEKVCAFEMMAQKLLEIDVRITTEYEYLKTAIPAFSAEIKELVDQIRGRIRG